MYIEYIVKSENDPISLPNNSPITDPTVKMAMLSNRCKAIFSDIVNILTVQDYSGASIDTLSKMCDLDKSEFVQDHGTFKSFLTPLEPNTDYIAYTDSAASKAPQSAQPFKSVDGVENLYQANTSFAACGTYLEFNAASTPEVPEAFRYLFVSVRASVTISGTRPEYAVYMCAANDQSEFNSTNLLGGFGLKKTAFTYKGIPNQMPLEFGQREGSIYETGNYALIFSMSSPVDNGGHVLVMPKTIVPATTQADGSFTYTSYNMMSSTFFMTRYDPIDYWYDTTNERVVGMTPWAVMSISPGGPNTNAAVGGQSLNIFNTSTQLVIDSTTSSKDLCLLKFAGSSATLGTPYYAYFNNKVSDRVKAEAINLIGINVMPVSPQVVLMGKVSSVSGIYYVGGQNLAYGDIISAVNANNTFVNYIVLPSRSLVPTNATPIDDDDKLKIAVPLV
jgi:hypothetical protein